MSRVRKKNKMKTHKTFNVSPAEDTYIAELEELYEKINNRHKANVRTRPPLGTLILVYLFRWYRIARDWVRKILIS